MMSNDSNNTMPERAAPDPAAAAAEAAAAAAAAQQNANAQAAQTLQDANALLASMNGSSAVSAPDSTAALNSLLGGDAAASTSTATISSLLGDNPPASAGPANSTAAIAGLLGSPSIPPQPGPSNLAIQNPQFAAAFAQSQNAPPDPSQEVNLGDDLLDDKAVDPSLSDLWQGMKDTTQKWTNAAGDLLHSHPIDSLAQSLGLNQNPNADPIDSAVHDCGVGMTAVALPHPAGGDAAAASCGKSFSNAAMNVLGLATD
ncbi:MAG TPA: hypothetical protein VIY68_05340 [Steroidobacteraceae bacterium]